MTNTQLSRLIYYIVLCADDSIDTKAVRWLEPVNRCVISGDVHIEERRGYGFAGRCLYHVGIQASRPDIKLVRRALDELENRLEIDGAIARKFEFRRDESAYTYADSVCDGEDVVHFKIMLNLYKGD